MQKANRGVRFLFETDDANAGRFKYVQFSDHNIAPTKAAHFHIFFAAIAKKVCSMKWTTGQRIIQAT